MTTSASPSLVIWGKDPSQKVLSALAPVLKQESSVKIEIWSDVTKPPPTMGVVLCLGNDIKELMEDLDVIPKKRTITYLRNHVFKGGDSSQYQFLFSYSPGICEMDYGKYVDLLTDVRAALRLARTGQIEPKTGDYQYVEDFTNLIQQITELNQKIGKPVDVAGDTETLGLDEYSPEGYLITIQFSALPGTAHLVYFSSRADMLEKLKPGTKLREQVEWLLNTPIVSMRGANFKYDLRWFARFGFLCSNFKMDTTLVGSLLDENRSNALNVHAKIYTDLGGYDDEFNRTADKSRMDLEYLKNPQQFAVYSGGDSDATLRVATAEKQELLQHTALTSFYVNILHPAARAFEVIERGGVFVDMDAYNELESALRTETKLLSERAKSIVGGRIWMKHLVSAKGGEINLGKPAFILDFMFSPMGLNLKPQMMTAGGADGTKEKSPSTALEHLLMFRDVPEAKEFVEVFRNYISATKTLNTYVTGFRKHIRSDGRFHPTYYLFAGNKDEDEGGTNTGRLSCKDPAFQTIPKHTKWAKMIRRCYRAPPGHLVLEVDYSQGELKVIACIANEQRMLEAYIKGMDLHVLTSGRFAGYSYEEMMQLKKVDEAKFEAIRQLGKAGNFGLIYGMGEDGFHSYAEHNYGVKLSLEEAGQFRNGFFTSYPALPVYHQTYKNFAHRHGYVCSPLGRIRHLPLINSPNRQVKSKAERQAINSPVQGTLSDMMLWAIAIANEQGFYDEAPCFGAVHDASYNYIPEDKAVECAKRQVELMENLPFEKVGWKPQLKFTADAKFGTNMADLKKVA